MECLDFAGAARVHLCQIQSIEGYIDEKSVMMEIMYSIKRAGANSIITYHALEIAEFLKNNEV